MYKNYITVYIILLNLFFSIIIIKIIMVLKFLVSSTSHHFLCLSSLHASPTICCCIVVRSGCKTASETELGPCPPNCKLTAESASSGSVDVSVKTDRQFIL